MLFRPSKLLTGILLVLVFCQVIAPAFMPVSETPGSFQVEIRKHPEKTSLAFSLLFDKYEKEEKEEKSGKKQNDRFSVVESPDLSYIISKRLTVCDPSHHGNGSNRISKAPLYQRHCIYII